MCITWCSKQIEHVRKGHSFEAQLHGHVRTPSSSPGVGSPDISTPSYQTTLKTRKH